MAIINLQNSILFLNNQPHYQKTFTDKIRLVKKLKQKEDTENGTDER